VRVAGESMRDAGIFDGDVLVVDCSITATHGHIVVAEVDFTVKRFAVRDGAAWLMPANPEFVPVRVDQRELRIVGVVTWRLGKLL
jgi:DNA polymerase V